MTGIYVHIPFCQAKCAYCDFNSYAGCESLWTPYLAALRREIARATARTVSGQTLYVGGGTPTVLPAAALADLIRALRHAFALSASAEVTVEANPGTVTVETLRSLRQAGVNRLSLGVQSLHDRLLHLLGRIHTAAEAEQAVADARQAGLDNLSLDLMFGLPEQTLQEWQESVRRALALSPQHLSLYALTVEPGTPLAVRIAGGTVPPPDEDLAAEMYEWAEEALAQAGYEHYEISNWARPGRACRHNLVYWRNRPYLGLGAGAHSWWDGVRWSNVRAPQAYIAALERGTLPVAETERIDRALEMGETMMMGLRLLQEGVSLDRFERRFGVPMPEVYAAEIEGLERRGLLERTSERIRLTQRGHLLGNQVFVEFIPDGPAPA